MTSQPPILVAGGGPAGCAAAITLARLGHAVRLLTRESSPHGGGLVVSLPPSVGKILDLLGARAAIDAAGFVATSGNTAWWGGDDAQATTFPEGATGWQADLGRLSAVLRAEAVRAGVAIDERRVEDSEPLVAAGWRVDATGRVGALARRVTTRIEEPTLRSVAMVGVWRPVTAWEVPDPSHTLIESYEDGWVWSVPVPSGDRHVAVMVDPRHSALTRGQSASSVYLEEVRKARRMQTLLARATLVEGPRGFDAAMYHSCRYAGGRTLLVGDAGSFVDPLSSSGVRKALVSGWTAAIVIHTSVLRPAMEAVAIEYFEQRERDMYGRLRQLARAHLAVAAARHPSPFWADRRFEDDAEALASPDAVRGALTRLRRASAPVMRAASLRIEPRPTIRGTEVVMEDRVVTADRPSGVRHVEGVDLLAALELAPRFWDVGLLYEAYCTRAGAVPLDAFLTALSTAVACDWLSVEDGTRPPSG